MPAPDHLHQIEKIIRLREAQVQLARLEGLTSRHALEVAREAERTSDLQRNEALATWHALVTERYCGPELADCAGSWLLEQERQHSSACKAADAAVLDHEAALEALGQSSVRHEAAKLIRDKVARMRARKKEDDQMNFIGDLLLHGHSR